MIIDLISQTYFSNIIQIKAVLIKSSLVVMYSGKIEVAMTIKSNYVIMANWLKVYLLICITCL